ncbi:MAG: hypothetical protein PHG77_12785, partial [Proteiniphilum sp.]|nr:hypothetical protein [Proteiniphilum sp.]
MKTTTMMAMAVLLLGCGTGRKVTERVVRETDSTAVWELKDSLQRKVTEISLLKTDLQRMREENVTLRSEGMTVEIKYDTAAPVDTTTGKPPVMSERITTLLNRYEKGVAEGEWWQKESSWQRENLLRENSSLQLTVETLTKENRKLKE